MRISKTTDAAESLPLTRPELEGKRKPPTKASYMQRASHIESVSIHGKVGLMPTLKVQSQTEREPFALLRTVDLVCAKAPEIIVRFKSIFEERKKTCGTIEYQAGEQALAQALNVLLARSLPKEYRHVLMISHEPSSNCRDPRFRADMRAALEIVERNHPQAVKWFYETQETAELCPDEALAGLFSLYADSGSVFPD